MARLDLFIDKLLKLEGGFVNHPNDNGGPTNMGIILSVWKTHGRDIDLDGKIDISDLKKITKADAYGIYKSQYWDKINATRIENQKVAELFFDYAVNSGISRAAKDVQRILKLTQDGQIGPKSLAAINGSDPKVLFEALKQRRIDFYNAIVRANPSQKVFLKGWMSRINSFNY